MVIASLTLPGDANSSGYTCDKGVKRYKILKQSTSVSVKQTIYQTEENT